MTALFTPVGYMRVALMKSIQGEKRLFLRTATIPHIAGRPGFDHLRERAMDVVEWFALVTVVVALYAIMSVALYRWSVDAPIFQPDSGAAAEQPFSWPY